MPKSPSSLISGFISSRTNSPVAVRSSTSISNNAVIDNSTSITTTSHDRISRGSSSAHSIVNTGSSIGVPDTSTSANMASERPSLSTISVSQSTGNINSGNNVMATPMSCRSTEQSTYAYSTASHPKSNTILDGDASAIVVQGPSYHHNTISPFHCNQVQENFDSSSALNQPWRKHTESITSNSSVALGTLNLDFSRSINETNCWRACPGYGGGVNKHTMVAYESHLYLFGGDDGKKMLNDVLRYDIQREVWEKIRTSGTPPAPRYHHSTVVYGNSMFVFGGYSGNIYSNSNLENRNDLIEYNFNTKSWVEWRTRGPRPRPRSAHGSVIYRDELYVFGGYDGNTRLNDMYKVSLKRGSYIKWVEVSQEDRPPTCCNFPTAVAGDYMYMYSGHAGSATDNALRSFNFITKRWRRIPDMHDCLGGDPAPHRRFGHTMVHHRGLLYVFGGTSDNTLRNDIFAYNLLRKTWHWVEPGCSSHLPSGRCFHSAVVVDDCMFVLGGTVDFSQQIKSSEMFQFQFSIYPECTLATDFEAFYQQGEFTDVKFIVGENCRSFSAHRCIVAARSSYLKTLMLESFKVLSSEDNNDNGMCITLADLDANAFQSTNTCLEAARCQLKLSISIYEIACKFQMVRLAYLCQRYVLKRLNVRNCLTVLVMIHHLGKTGLLDFVLNFVVRKSNYRTVILSQDFAELDQEIVVEIVRLQSTTLDNATVLDNNTSNPGCGSSGNEISFDGLDNHDGSLGSDMERFLTDETTTSKGMFVDVYLRLRNRSVKAHRAILAARSQYFRAMFSSSMLEASTRAVDIIINDIIPTFDAFGSLMRFIYCGDVNMPPQNCLYLYMAPLYIGLTNTRLQIYCKTILEQNITNSNVLHVLEAASEIGATEMRDHAVDIIVSNFHNVARDPMIEQLSNPLLVTILRGVASVTQFGISRTVRVNGGAITLNCGPIVLGGGGGDSVENSSLVQMLSQLQWPQAISEQPQSEEPKPVQSNMTPSNTTLTLQQRQTMPPSTEGYHEMYGTQT